jgi:hypothetical protein
VLGFENQFRLQVILEALFGFGSDPVRVVLAPDKALGFVFGGAGFAVVPA